jgi:transposase-like protein/IS1 family transposase
MIAPNPNTCTHEHCKKDGKTKAGTQRYLCLDCGKRFTTGTKQLDGMRIGPKRAAQVLTMLCEGMSVAGTARVTGTNKNTILSLLAIVGQRCQQFLSRKIRGIEVSDVQCDEIWQFIYCKRRNELHAWVYGRRGQFGDSWTFTAIERTTKLVLAWHFGKRTSGDADVFCAKLKYATKGHFHLSTDDYQSYNTSVPRYFAGQVDYGQLVKIFGKSSVEDQRTYSPAKIISTRKEVVMGSPDEDRICTSHSERSNGTIRNFTKRMGRLTYCFSKKWENHEAALGLYFAHYNFCRRHSSLRGQTPAMASGLADHAWTISELLTAIAA